LTPAETTAKVQGYIRNLDRMSANFRALFWLSFNQFAKTPKKAESLWPLSIDGDKTGGVADEDMYERNTRIIKAMGSN